MDIVKTLEEVGLQEREIRIYIALLEIGESTVLPIANKSGIKRTYCYDILDDLKKKSLVTYVEKNGRRRYVAEDPKNIEQVLKDRVHRFSEVLPELRSLYNNNPKKPKIRFYEGTNEVIELSEIATNSKDLMAITSADAIYKVFGKKIDEIGEKVASSGQRTRELVSSNLRTANWGKNYKKPLQEIRYLPKGVKLSTDMLIYENKLVLMSYEKDIHAVMIEGSSIVDTHKQLFELLWLATPESIEEAS